MTLPFGTNLFLPRGELIETFDFSDIATGLGFEVFWGTPSVDTGGTDYNLLSFQITSGDGDVNTSQSGVGTTTINFDTSTFNLPRTAKGTAYVSCGAQATVTLATSIKAQIAVVDSGGTPRTISSEFECPQVIGIVGIRTQLLALPLTQTTIKKGEKLRMIIKVVVDASGGVGGILHDNTNSDIDQHLKLLMPFRIES